MADPKDLKGLERCYFLYGGKEVVHERMKRELLGDPGLVEIFNDLVYFGLDARNVLDPKTQQLCGIAALTALNAPAQLKTHLKMGLRAGATDVEIKEVIVQTARYCGIPYMNTALTAFHEVMREWHDTNETKR